MHKHFRPDHFRKFGLMLCPGLVNLQRENTEEKLSFDTDGSRHLALWRASSRTGATASYGYEHMFG